MANDNATMLLDSCIRRFESDNSITVTNDGDLFEIFSLYNITKEHGLSLSELYDSIVDGPLDGGIDSFIILVNDKYIYELDEIHDIDMRQNSTIKIYIIQSKRSTRFKESALNKLHVSLDIIFNLSHKTSKQKNVFNEMLIEKIKIFRDLWEKSAEFGAKMYVKCYYASRGNTNQLNTSIIEKKELISNNCRDNLVGVDFDFEFVGSKELIDLHNKMQNYKLRLEFKELPSGIAFKDSPDIGYIGTTTLEEYYSFITDENGSIRENIFENNIRFYQGDVDVNKRILKTLEEDETRDFWWLNNGITIVASRCKPLSKVLYIDDAQIVNGLQTSFVIYQYLKSNTGSAINKERSILVKVIISDNKETIDKVIFSANSQTPITHALLRATDDVQRDLELYFQDKGYYYDRRKNYYRLKDKPLHKIFDIQYTAQCVHAIINLNPSKARSKPTSLIKEDHVYESIFKKDTDYQVYLNCCIIRRIIEDYIKCIKRDAEDEPTKNAYKNIYKYFTLHLARIVPSIYFKSANYTIDEIASVDTNNINDELITEAIKILGEYLSIYGKYNNDDNIINMSKSSSFSDGLNNYINDHYSKT